MHWMRIDGALLLPNSCFRIPLRPGSRSHTQFKAARILAQNDLGNLDETLGGTISAAINPDLGGDPAAGFFAFLQYYPLPILISLVSIFMLWIFFVAGADAGTIVLGQMSAGGIEDTNRFIRLAWGVVIGAMAFVLLLSGGLDALRQAALLAGVPFAIIMIFMCYALYKGLRADFREQDRQEESQEVAAEASTSKPTPSRES
jgi:glycine betaine transporter